MDTYIPPESVCRERNALSLGTLVDSTKVIAMLVLSRPSRGMNYVLSRSVNLNRNRYSRETVRTIAAKLFGILPRERFIALIVRLSS